MSQTGIRISELLGLKEDCIDYIYNKTLNKKLCYLNYETTKRIRKVETKSIVRTFVNELTLQNVELLRELLKTERINSKTDYLFALKTKQNAKLPINSGAFNQYYHNLGVEVSKYMDIVNNDDTEWINLSKYKVDQGKAIFTITMPRTHQFRTHLCTELYESGVMIEYIETFMSHLSLSMKGYHIYHRNSIQENYEYSQKVLYNIVSEQTVILGGDNGLKSKIDKFIQDNNFSIVKDIDEIVNQLSKKIPIRQKNGGVCIKSSGLRECSNDAMTNEFYCAYGVCPNICYFFYMIDVAYRQCSELIETIEYNKQNNFNKQAQKETNMLSVIMKSKLIPEYDEMIRMLSQNSVETLVAKYPNIETFLRDPDIVKEKIDKWKIEYNKE